MQKFNIDLYVMPTVVNPETIKKANPSNSFIELKEEIKSIIEEERFQKIYELNPTDEIEITDLKNKYQDIHSEYDNVIKRIESTENEELHVIVSERNLTITDKHIAELTSVELLEKHSVDLQAYTRYLNVQAGNKYIDILKDENTGNLFVAEVDINNSKYDMVGEHFDLEDVEGAKKYFKELTGVNYESLALKYINASEKEMLIQNKYLVEKLPIEIDGNFYANAYSLNGELHTLHWNENDPLNNPKIFENKAPYAVAYDLQSANVISERNVDNFITGLEVDERRKVIHKSSVSLDEKTFIDATLFTIEEREHKDVSSTNSGTIIEDLKSESAYQPKLVGAWNDEIEAKKHLQENYQSISLDKELSSLQDKGLIVEQDTEKIQSVDLEVNKAQEVGRDL